MSEHASHDPDQLLLFDLQEQERSVEYSLITGHYTTDKSFKTTEQVHTEYVRLTDELIHKAVDGVEVRDPHSGEKSVEKVDYFVWLDKSARPVSWLTKELWPTLAQDADGSIPAMPQSKYVNIDRNQWTSTIDPEGVGYSNVDRIDPSIIRSLRSVFLTNANDRDKGLTKALDYAPTIFDFKTILIVDEVMSSGRTLDYAQRFFARAFPDTKVAGAHWMAGLTSKKGAIGNSDIPVWYSDATELGRGIGNRNVDASLGSKNRTQRLGAYFLSTALGGVDEKSTRLRSEISQLGKDARSGKILIVPSLKRDEADFDERATRLNNLGSVEEFISAKHQLDTMAAPE